MKWEILILTQPSRAQFLMQLLRLLELPTARFTKQTVSVFVRQFDSSMTLGENREAMRQNSRGDYISFVDDDDFVPPGYAERILPLLDGVDQVGFNVNITRNGKPYGLAVHGLKHGGWKDKMNFLDGGAGHLFERDISHLNPMRRDLALAVPMSGGIGEDHRWADAMRGKVHTEHFLNEVMYYYLWREPKNDAQDALNDSRLRLWESLKAKV